MRSIIEKKNKKGQIQGVLLAVITIFVVAIILFFLNHLNREIYSGLDDYLEGSKYKDTEAQAVVQDLEQIETSRIWDYAFLAIFVGMMINMLIFSFASRTNVAFFWIFVLMGIVILIVGTVLSNIWQEIAVNPEFSTTIDRFIITNTLLGTHYPTIITGLLFLGMIIMFGKFPGGRE